MLVREVHLRKRTNINGWKGVVRKRRGDKSFRQVFSYTERDTST